MVLEKRHHWNSRVFGWHHICDELPDLFLNGQSAFLSVPAGLLASLNWSLFVSSRLHAGLHKKTKLDQSFNITPRYIVLSPNNSNCDDRIYPIELEIKDTTDTARSASYLDPHLENDSEGLLRTKHYDIRDYFNFLIYMLQHSSNTCKWSI